MSSLLKSLIITIEGTDGSGKATQTKLLKETLEKKGHKVITFSFPRYNLDSSLPIRQYLQGWFGEAKEISPKIASALYAYDRYIASIEIKQALYSGYTVILDRWVSANKGHQLGKIKNHKKRVEFIEWLNNLEYKENKVPIPDLTLFLHLPTDQNKTYKSSGKKGGVGGKKGDIHEKDIQHLKDAEDAYLWCINNDKSENWIKVSCLDKKNKRLSIEDLHKNIWKIVNSYL